MALGEADPSAARRRAREDRQSLTLDERDGGVPRAACVDVRPGDQDGVLRFLEPAREIGDHVRPGDSRAGNDAACGMAYGAVVHLGSPVVHRDRHECRPLRRQTGRVDGPRDRVRHVLSARRLVAPLDERLRHAHGVAVGQIGLQRHQRACLIAGCDDQWRVVRLRVEDRAHRVAHAGRRVQVHERRPAARLREAVGHADHDRLLKAEHVAEVGGKVGQHRQLGRPRVAEDRRDAVLAEQVVSRVLDRGHSAAGLYASRAMAGLVRRTACARVIVAAVTSATVATSAYGTMSCVACASAPPPAVAIVWAAAHARFISANA